jgi:hypothetical protein
MLQDSTGLFKIWSFGTTSQDNRNSFLLALSLRPCFCRKFEPVTGLQIRVDETENFWNCTHNIYVYIHHSSKEMT